MRPMLAEPVFIGLVMIAMLALFLMTVITVVIGLVVYLSRQNSPQKAAAPGVPVPPAFAKTQVMPHQCPQCGAQLKPDAPEGLCPACLLKRGLATEGGAPSGAPTFVPPPIPELAVLFPQLEIIECLGRGGMGAVYKTRQPRLDRFEALKILAPEKQNDAQFAERFEREARALARLNHPNIVTVYGFGEVQGRFYLLMEFVDGLTLRQVLQGGKMTPTEALKIVPKICDALQYAHEQGIVHRDIKPENILLDKQGRVKIADFGIAKIAGLESRDLSLTGAQDVMGTPHYMAPEQVEQPQSVDHRADIYSLGVVFYEMLTGELPLGKFAPPSEKTPLDTRLDEVVMHSLEKEPARRYQQASQVKTDVETIAGSPGAVSASKPAAAAPPPVAPATISPVATTVDNASEKTILPAFLLAFFFGVFGAHRFYAGKMITGCLQLAGFIGWVLLIIACATTGATWQPELGISLGFLIVGCGIWSTIDWILIVCKAFTDGKGRRITHWVSPQGGGSPGNSTPVNPPTPAATAIPATGNHAMITAPAICLMVVGVWKIVSVITGVIFFANGNPWHELVPMPLELGHLIPTAIISSLFFQLVPGIFIIIGGYQMLHRRSYGWAMAAGILSLLACSLIGLPIGIWTMIVLAREDVRATFNNPASAHTAPLPGQSGWHPAAIIGGGILLLLLLLLIAAISLFHIPSVRAGSIGRELDSAALQSAGIRQEGGEYKKDFNQSFPLAADGRFSLDNISGQTEIHGWNSNTVSVQAVIHGQSSAYVNAVQIDMDSTADQVTVHTRTPKSNGFSWSWFVGNWNNNADVDYIVYAPQHAVLDKIESVNGSIQINGVAGAITTSTVNGQIQVKDAADDLKASTVNGQIAITMTALGNGHHVSLDAVNGQLELTLPADADATFSSDTVNGSINSEFPGLEVQHEFPVGSKLKGALGHGSATVKATTVNGGFRIKKQSTP